MSSNIPPRGFIDETDRRLLTELTADGRLSYHALAERAGTSEPEARRRVEAMVQSGAITRFTIERGGGGASAVVLVSVESGHDTAQVSEDLAGIRGARTVYEITGQYDIMVVLEADSISAINDHIDQLRRASGVSDTNTTIILRKVR